MNACSTAVLKVRSGQFWGPRNVSCRNRFYESTIAQQKTPRTLTRKGKLAKSKIGMEPLLAITIFQMYLP